MTNQTFKRICIEKLKEVAPEAYRECVRLTTPRLKNVKHIHEIIKYVVSQGYDNNSINAPIIIGVVYALLYPYKIYYNNLRLPLKVRDLISKEMGFNNSEMINYHANMLPVFAKGRWLKKIESLADGYLEQMGNGE